MLNLPRHAVPLVAAWVLSLGCQPQGPSSAKAQGSEESQAAAASADLAGIEGEVAAWAQAQAEAARDGLGEAATKLKAYSAPSGDAAAQLAFVKEIERQKLVDDENQAVRRADYLLQLAGQITAASRVFHAEGASNAMRAEAATALGRAVLVMQMLKAPGAAEQFDALADAFREAKLTSIASELEKRRDEMMAQSARAELITRINEVIQPAMDGDSEAAQRIADISVEALADPEIDPFVVNQLQEVALYLEIFDQTEAAKQIYTAVQAATKSGPLAADPNAAYFANAAASGLKRIRLLGTKPELEAVRLDGQPVSLESLRGKVVLLDFWATWCGPCLSEIPFMKEAYETYHDRGFEILGVSLDDNLADVADLVEQRELPWIITFERNAENQGVGSDPRAEAFGVNSIPAMFLLDAEGTVVALHPRRDRLMSKLAELFGDPAPAAPIDEEPAPTSPDAEE